MSYDWMANDVVFELAILAIAVIAGMFGSILGLGGGVVVVPALTLGCGVPIRYAIGASIIAVIATSCGAAATYVRDHITNIRVAMLLEMATSLGALGGALVSDRLPPRLLYALFAATMVYSAVTMFRGRKAKAISREASSLLARRLQLDSDYPDPAEGGTIAYGVTGVPLAFTLMIGAGVISALLGIGSGSLKVPAMDSAMHLPIKVSSATSNFMIGVTAAASAGNYYMRGDIVPFLAAPVALGVLLGAWIGTHLMMRMSGVWIRRCFVAILLVIAVEMGLNAAGYAVR
jgi:uncharacterized membrane protein YfcA